MTKFDLPATPLSEIVEEDVAAVISALDKLIEKPDGTATLDETIAAFRSKYS